VREHRPPGDVDRDDVDDVPHPAIVTGAGYLPRNPATCDAATVSAAAGATIETGAP
jgi:hypothetical protein